MFKTCEWKESSDEIDDFKDYDSVQVILSLFSSILGELGLMI
jgi:hypothetical protein